MEIWFVALVLFIIFIIVLLKFIINLFFTAQKLTLPPNPSIFPTIGNFLWHRRSFHLEPILRSLHAYFGSIISLRFGSTLSIFIADRSLTHQALIQKGAMFADRPKPYATAKVLGSNQHNISTAFYGPIWHLLRQNLTTEILHPLSVKSYANLRNWVLQILLKRLYSHVKSGHPFFVADHFHYSMFALLALVCFGDKLDENKIKKLEQVQRQILSISFDIKFKILNFWPVMTKIVLYRQWKKLHEICKSQEDVLTPLIRARRKLKEKDDYFVSYVDTLLALELPDDDIRDQKWFNEGQIISLCSEFLNAGSETTSTALQWIMANLVKYPQIQEKLFMEIKSVMTNREEEEVKEDDLQKMPFLKAVILEGLRRHPPLHFSLPHAATEDAALDKFVIPKSGIINFMIAEIGLNPTMWEDPMAFKPERFLNNGSEAFDLTGSKEIKMMPFGVGRRMCPGYGLAVLHLEYFVANLIWKFEWKAVDGDDVDLSEKVEFTVVMKNPLHAYISPRFIQISW